MAKNYDLPSLMLARVFDNMLRSVIILSVLMKFDRVAGVTLFIVAALLWWMFYLRIRKQVCYAWLGPVSDEKAVAQTAKVKPRKASGKALNKANSPANAANGSQDACTASGRKAKRKAKKVEIKTDKVEIAKEPQMQQEPEELPQRIQGEASFSHATSQAILGKDFIASEETAAMSDTTPSLDTEEHLSTISSSEDQSSQDIFGMYGLNCKVQRFDLDTYTWVPHHFDELDGEDYEDEREFESQEGAALATASTEQGLMELLGEREQDAYAAAGQGGQRSFCDVHRTPDEISAFFLRCLQNVEQKDLPMLPPLAMAPSSTADLPLRPPAPASAIVGARSQSMESDARADFEKEIMKLKKKEREIEHLKQKIANGDTVDKLQLKKVGSEDEIKRALNEFTWLLATWEQENGEQPELGAASSPVQGAQPTSSPSRTPLSCLRKSFELFVPAGAVPLTPEFQCTSDTNPFGFAQRTESFGKRVTDSTEAGTDEASGDERNNVLAQLCQMPSQPTSGWNSCWEWIQTGRCPRGNYCRWGHPPLSTPEHQPPPGLFQP